jgi:deazaflavin-dependent oxidoreductase (nitroreductase family)
MTALGESRPTELLRRLLRAPIWLYRLHLGRLLGHRFLLLTHLGRKSGQERQTVVEVVRYDPATHESVVFAGWRGETDWYRNILAHPAIVVETGGERYSPEQRLLDADEVVAELRDAYARHPFELREGIGRLFGLEIDGSERGFAAAAAFFRGVAFRPHHGAMGQGASRGAHTREGGDLG